MFIHVLLNALDFSDKDYEIKLVIEGSATKLIPQPEKDNNPLSSLYKKVKKEVLLVGACKACAQKMGTPQAAEASNIYGKMSVQNRTQAVAKARALGLLST